MPKTIALSSPLGFCDGVRRAMELFEQTALRYPGETIYVLYELVHNHMVTERMRHRGACFVHSLADIPDGAVALFGAHGVGATVIEEAERRGIRYCDAVCPLVARLQRIVFQMSPDCPLILLGDREHPEVRSIMERAAAHEIHVIERMEDMANVPPMPKALFLSQTTRNRKEVAEIAAALARRIPELDNKSGVCDAVARRQEAVLELSKNCDCVLVVASPHSANGCRLAEIASRHCPALMVEGPDSLADKDLTDYHSIGISAATSTPDEAIQGIVSELQRRGYRLP